MQKKNKFIIEEEFNSKNTEERQKKINEILIEIIKKSELHKVA